MKKAKMTICLVLVLFLATGVTRADFTLYDNEELTVNSSHITGTLYDTSRAFIVSGGDVNGLYAYNSSTVNISSGHVNGLGSYNYSVVNISGGYVDHGLFSHSNSTVNVSGGDASLLLYDNSDANITGGFAEILFTLDNSAANITGGSMDELYATNSSIVSFYGQNFGGGSGITFDGARVLGTGLLFGEWLDGKPWTVHIITHDPTATILMAIPEPATLLLLGLGAVMLRRKH